MIDDGYEQNDEQETLCCLALGFKQQNETYELTSWEASFSYPNKKIRKLSCAASIEKYCLTGLTHELLYCKTLEVPVVTYRITDIPAVRLRLLFHHIPVNLHGMNFICLQQIFQDYFVLPRRSHNYASITDMAETMNINATDATSSELLYELYVRTLPLLPTRVI